MKKFLVLLVTILLLINVNHSYSQQKKLKFGKVSEEDIKMEYYDKDSTANAVILYDVGIQTSDYNRHRIIKVLTEEGKKYADFYLRLFNNGSLNSFKAITYNYENGEIVTTELKFKDLLFEKTYDYITTVKAAFPNVKKGSVIEVMYSKFSIDMQWYFQYDNIPVKYSEYSISIPSYFKVFINERGFADIDTHYEKGVGSTIEDIRYSWYAENIPAFQVEEYTTSTNIYKKRVEFELSHVQYRGITYDDVSTWEKVDQKLNESIYFGGKFKHSIYLKNISDTLFLDSLSKFEKMKMIYSFLQNSLKYSEFESKFCYRNYREIFNKKLATSGEINCALIALLKMNDIVVEPIILSTRENGMLYPDHPTVRQFNYVIAKVTLDGLEYYLDASEKLLPIGLLPKRCYNGIARITSEKNSSLIILQALAPDNSIFMYMLSFDKEKIVGNVNKVYYDYAAFDKRKEIEEIGNLKIYKDKMIEKSTTDLITDLIIENYDSIYKPYSEIYSIETNDNITFTGNLIYLTPLLNERIKDNPFKLEEREYPIDYGYPISKRIVMQYSIPENYEVIELPESINLILPDKSANFQFQTMITGNTIQILSNFKINQPIFQYDSYKALKNFYNIIIEKQNEKIILKKKS